MGIIGWLIFGGLVGWIASKIMGTDAQQGILLNIIVGIVGALLGGFLWGMISGDPEPYQLWDVGSWVTAIIGASVLLWIVSFFQRRPRVV
ncbi:MAG TPA: GlsB/YeaQ/YmgE family stress response membrane protein [Patescibacteria group bacterium]|nr:GlsB/YeaQ/YmgE family stress response membrane protein [Patescibacteria group bacterium]